VAGIRRQKFAKQNDPDKCEELLKSTEGEVLFEHDNGVVISVKLQHAGF
jgi:hypothetical protein